MNWHLWHFLPYHLRALLSFVIVDHWSLIWFDDFKIAQSAEKRAAAGPWQLHPDWQTFTTYSNISVRIISLIHDHSMHIWVSHSFTFLRFEEPRLHLLIGTHPWPTEDLSDSLCPTALLSPVSRAHQQCIICTIGFIIHTPTYIYTYYQYCPTSMLLLLPVDSHDLSSTSIFWHEMNHEGFSTCQAAAGA